MDRHLRYERGRDRERYRERECERERESHKHMCPYTNCICSLLYIYTDVYTRKHSCKKIKKKKPRVQVFGFQVHAVIKKLEVGPVIRQQTSAYVIISTPS